MYLNVSAFILDLSPKAHWLTEGACFIFDADEFTFDKSDPAKSLFCFDEYEEDY